MSLVRARTLRLRAADAAQLRRGVGTVENALRSASLADNSRVYVVRRFALGRIGAAARPEALAATISERFSQLRARALHATAPGAAAGDVVWFHDALEPLRLIAERLLSGTPANEWFWRLVVPALGELPVPDRPAFALEALARSPAGAAALPPVVLRALDQHRGALFHALGRIDAGVLFAAMGWALPVRERRSSVASARDEEAATAEPRLMPVGLDPILSSVLREAERIWSSFDARLDWIAAMFLLARTPALAANPRRLLSLAARVRTIALAAPPSASERPFTRTPAAFHGVRPERGARRAQPRASPFREHGAESSPSMADLPMIPPGPALGETHSAVQRLPPASDSGASSTSSTAASAWQSAREVAIAAKAEAKAHVERDAVAPIMEGEAPAGLLPDPLATAAGGLLFLVAALERMGLSAFLEHAPAALELGFPARLLARIALSAGLDRDDAMLQRLAALFGPAPDHSWSWRPPRALAEHLGARRWQRANARAQEVVPASDPAHTASLAPLFSLFFYACAAFCRARVGCSLRKVVVRPAYVSTSATHIDVGFAMRSADARIRMAGLDVNPGWVPWLGRVVSFHYREEYAPEAPAGAPDMRQRAR